MTHRAAAVASRAIELALRRKEFRVTDIQRGLSEPPSRQTIYRVLNQLQEDDWINNQGNLWKPSVKANLLSDIESESQSMSSPFKDLVK
ncbi:hypothetical protein HSRCO_3010 (plasmid) [Halanaeroarchaeum sp. HSR-CO]|uniref:hypothetical protein n=1 Tax=Halanaeroarchaeum sp. HSR-CO TaxID=2866382 RepID=UPI00217D82DA|nr:hypothetical protein [Halanaeroarchaeum sp. HSR-CO]UWG49151.1 hypothetical protein HSRCO_3010 [Halanaeroarchaeum sp. HSR-CO]